MQEIKQYQFKGVKFKSYNNLDKDLDIMSGYFEHYFPKKGDVVIDCGAYVGCFTIIASKLLGLKGKVIAIEPDLVSYRKLLSNIELNKLKNVIALNVGLWCKKTKLMFSAKGSRGSSFVFGNNKNKLTNVNTLDNIVKNLNIGQIDFIKMDLEGSELFVLKGAKKTMTKYLPDLAIATYHIVNGKTTDKGIEKFLNTLKYKTKTGFLKHKVTYGMK